VDSKTGSKTKTKQGKGKTGRQCGNNEGHGAATEPTRRVGGTGPDQTRGAEVTTGEAATELTGPDQTRGAELKAGEVATEQTREAGELTNVTAGEAAMELTELPYGTEATGRLGGTGPDQTRVAAALTGQLEATAGEKAAEQLDSAGKKRGEDKSAKSKRGRDKNGRRGKQSGS